MVPHDMLVALAESERLNSNLRRIAEDGMSEAAFVA